MADELNKSWVLHGETLQSSVCPSEGVHATMFDYKKLF